VVVWSYETVGVIGGSWLSVRVCQNPRTERFFWWVKLSRFAVVS